MQCNTRRTAREKDKGRGQEEKANKYDEDITYGIAYWARRQPLCDDLRILKTVYEDAPRSVF
jgi:hypothetical protein